MLEEFKGINEAEFNQLKDAVSSIAILIAGADGSIKEHETEWAVKVTKIRSYNLPRRLSAFYKEVGLSFKNDLDVLKAEFVQDQEATVRKLKFQLATLNDVFEKMEDHQLAYELYVSFKSFARHVARSTGGILGWGAIGPKEDELIELSMIHPVHPPAAH